MAPEVVRGDKLPDKLTDRFSLSVVLFMLLIGNHPLEGQKTNVPAFTSKYNKRFYGTEPIFIFDEHNESNRPRAGLHKNAINFWPSIPKFLKRAFQQSFSQDSMLNLNGRLLEKEWFTLLVWLKCSITKCPNCKVEIFLDSDRVTKCPACKKDVATVGYFKFEKRRSNIELKVPIHEGIRLYDYNMFENSEDFHTEAARVLVKPGKIGLENKSKYIWSITSTSGKTSETKQGGVTLLSIGSKIDFGNGNIAEVISN